MMLWVECLGRQRGKCLNAVLMGAMGIVADIAARPENISSLAPLIPALFSFPKLDPGLKKIMGNYYRYDMDSVTDRMAA